MNLSQNFAKNMVLEKLVSREYNFANSEIDKNSREHLFANGDIGNYSISRKSQKFILVKMCSPTCVVGSVNFKIYRQIILHYRL